MMLKGNAGMVLALWMGMVGAVSAEEAADFRPASQAFEQEVATCYTASEGGPAGRVTIIDCYGEGGVRAMADGQWWVLTDGKWRVDEVLKQEDAAHLVLADAQGKARRVDLPWGEARQILRRRGTSYVTGTHVCMALSDKGAAVSLGAPRGLEMREVAVTEDANLIAATSGGLWSWDGKAWKIMSVRDGLGRAWAVGDVPGVACDGKGQLWFASKAGAGCRATNGWRFFEGKDGLPWNDFTGMAAGPRGEVWFATHLGVERFDERGWAYRQGLRWLPNDDVTQVTVDGAGNAWFATAGGVGKIGQRRMTLAEKAEYYEADIARYVKRTDYGYVARGPLRRPGIKASSAPEDDDNDGLWTAMYGAGECFAYAATKNPEAKERAREAFEALRFLQKVTQGCEHAPPRGYVARSIRPISGPDPNAGGVERDRQQQEHGDRLWKVYEPRWPKSADRKWYWKSDTSSDELDGHYFFYPLYYEFCADTEEERARVREVVRDLTDDLMEHGYNLVDFDGKPTRWGVYAPASLNHDPDWWPERGLKSLSMLSYLADAAYVTEDAKYEAASRELIERDGYAQNAMMAKLQRGPGTGNESDNEMAVMSYYNLLRYSRDEGLKKMMRESFYLYWLNLAPEMNPFFNFAYAGENLKAKASTPWGEFSIQPGAGWNEDAMAALRGFPLEWINWPLRNSHRLDVVALPPAQAREPDDPADGRRRGNLVNNKVIAVENRYFDHWNTDPWELDYGGNGDVLGAGTVFLLPFYLGLYEGFIEKVK